MESMWNKIVEFFKTAGVRILIGILIVVVGLILVKVIKVVLTKLLKRADRDEAITHFIVSLIDVLLKIAIFISALATMGVNTASLITVLGTCGVAIGLALKDSLSNIAAGVMIIYNKPFKKGDYIVTPDIEGNVDQINLFNTTLITSDNKEVFIPNGELTKEHIVNYNTLGERRMDLKFRIALKADYKKAAAVIKKVAEKHDKVLKERELFCRMVEQTESALVMQLRLWTTAGDYSEVEFDLNEQVKDALDSARVPYPTATLKIQTSK